MPGSSLGNSHDEQIAATEREPEVDGFGHCVRCGEYAPKTLDGTRRIHECDASPSLDGLPVIVTVCPTCGRAGRYRWGCWGTEEHPHEHVYMVTTRELVARVPA